MNCKEVRSKLSEFIDGELDAATRADVSAHIETCTGCRRELRELEETIGLLHSLEEVKVPADLAGRVRRRIAEDSARPAAGRSWYFLSSPQFRVAAAACLVLGICTYGLLHVPGAFTERASDKVVVRTVGKGNAAGRDKLSVAAKRQSGASAAAADLKRDRAESIVSVETVPASAPADSFSKESGGNESERQFVGGVGSGKTFSQATDGRSAVNGKAGAEMKFTRARPAEVGTPSGQTGLRKTEAGRVESVSAVSGPRTGLYEGEEYKALDKTDSRYRDLRKDEVATISSEKAPAREIASHISEPGRRAASDEMKTGRTRTDNPPARDQTVCQLPLGGSGLGGRAGPPVVSTAPTLAMDAGKAADGTSFRITVVTSNDVAMVLGVIDRFSPRSNSMNLTGFAYGEKAKEMSRSKVAAKDVRFVHIARSDYARLVGELRKVGAVSEEPQRQVPPSEPGESAETVAETDTARTILISIEIRKK